MPHKQIKVKANLRTLERRKKPFSQKKSLKGEKGIPPGMSQNNLVFSSHLQGNHRSVCVLLWWDLMHKNASKKALRRNVSLLLYSLEEKKELHNFNSL